MNVVVAKEIELRGTFRFHEEFALAVALIGGGLVDVMPLLTETVPLAEANDAFELAADRSRAMKVQLAFGPDHDNRRGHPAKAGPSGHPANDSAR